MSDTDDTDVLLLIPPDFFFVHSDSDSTIDEPNWNRNCNLHSTVVKSLFDELDDVKSRIASIENHSEVSSIYVNARDGFGSTDSIMSRGNYMDELNAKFGMNSAKSTPQKPRTKLNLNSLPNTPNEADRRRIRKSFGEFTLKTQPKNVGTSFGYSNYQNNDRDADESSLMTTPEKKQNKEVLGEIDQFLSHVKTIKRYVTQKKLETNFPNDDSQKQPESLPISFENAPLKLSDLNSEKNVDKHNRLDLKDVDKLLNEMEQQQQRMEKHKPVYDVKRVIEGDEYETHTWKPGENKNTVPDYGYGMRDILFSKEENKKLSSAFQNYKPRKSETNTDSDTTNDTSPPTVLERSSGEDLLHPPIELNRKPNAVYDYSPMYTEGPPQKLKPVTEDKIMKKSSGEMQASRYKRNQVYGISTVPQVSSTNLYDIHDPWSYNNQRGDFVSKDTKVLTKLDEERLRRQHCEKIIQDLQLKHLEMQQRLAVAVQVDCAKDAAILRFHEAWEKVADRWNVLETERNHLALKLSSVKGKSESEITDAKKKMTQYESEISKALNLAHNNQEKTQNLESEKEKLMKEMELIRAELEKLMKKLSEVEKERLELNDKHVEIERKHLEDKKLIMELKKENENLKQSTSKDIGSYQIEIKQLREEKSLVERQIKDIQGSFEDLMTRNKGLEHAVQNYKKSEKMLQTEIKNLMEQADKTKLDLRNFYQQQVEILVKDKLREFQSQLEQTEQVLHQELQNREQTIAKTAAKQLQKLADKHHLELQLVEEKHKEQINLYDLQVKQLQHVIEAQQNKLDQIQLKRNNIAQELKTIMEAQWTEALKIINNGRSPDLPKPSGIQSRFSSYEPIKPVSNPKDRSDLDKDQRPESDRRKFQPENELQKYIKMLLDKEPGSVCNDVDEKPSAIFTTADANHDLSSFSKVSGLGDIDDYDRKGDATSEQQKMSMGKPPWR